MIQYDEFVGLMKSATKSNFDDPKISKLDSVSTFRSSPRKQQINYPKEQETLLHHAQNLIKQTRVISIRKKFRLVLHAFKFIRRLKKVFHESPYMHCLANLNKVKKTTLKFPETINERFQTWCNGICQKIFSTIPNDLYDYVNLKTNKVKKDKTQLIMINSIQFFLENMAYYTHPEILCLEIKHYLFSQLFLSQKTNFTQFVSSRTLYIQNLSNLISLEEQAMIVSEVLIFFKIAFILFDKQKNNSFTLIMLISFLQYLFYKRFATLKKIHNNHQNLEQIVIQKDKVTGIYSLTIQPMKSIFSKDKIVEGTFQDEIIEELLTIRPNFEVKVLQYFDKTIEHLQHFLAEFYQ